MTQQLDLDELIHEATEEEILELALTLARALDLPVDTWQPGDPTRAAFELLALHLASKEKNRAGFARSASLDHSEDSWLDWKALQDYDLTVPAATFAETDIVLTNNGDGLFVAESEGDLVVKNTTTGKTFRNTTTGELAPGGTLILHVVADEAGSDSNSSAGEIDDLVTGWSDVDVTNPVAAIARDKQDAATTRAQCRRKWSSLSPNGPRGAYEFVALNEELTGTSGITRAREFGDTDTGDVTLYIAGPSGAVSSEDRGLVEDAVVRLCTPICTTPTVLSASPVTIDVTYELWVYSTANKTVEELEEDVEAALEAMVARVDIGGDIIPPATTGSVYRSLIEATVLGAVAEGEAFRVSVTTPVGDTALTDGQVPALGTVTATIHLVTR